MFFAARLTNYEIYNKYKGIHLFLWNRGRFGGFQIHLGGYTFRHVYTYRRVPLYTVLGPPKISGFFWLIKS